MSSSSARRAVVLASVPAGRGYRLGLDRLASSVLCPELVGREAERRELRVRVEDLAAGRGGVVVLLGEAGAGKSRLARDAIEVAAGRAAAVLAGRSVPGPSPVPYRPLTEALLGAFRATRLPDDPALDGFLGHLGRLVPAWRSDAVSADESPVLLAEAVVRLLVVHGGNAGTIVLLEDVHWPIRRRLLSSTTSPTRSRPRLSCAWRPAGPMAPPSISSSASSAAIRAPSCALHRWTTGRWSKCSRHASRPHPRPARSSTSSGPTATAARSSWRSSLPASSPRAHCSRMPVAGPARGRCAPPCRPASARRSASASTR